MHQFNPICVKTDKSSFVNVIQLKNISTIVLTDSVFKFDKSTYSKLVQLQNIFSIFLAFGVTIFKLINFKLVQPKNISCIILIPEPSKFERSIYVIFSKL